MNKEQGSDGSNKFVVRADYFGEIISNSRKTFWLPVSSGTLYFSGDKVHYRQFNSKEDIVSMEFAKIIKVKMQSLDPRKNQWTRWAMDSPYFLLFWNPFWNRFIINITYLNDKGNPKEVFFKLKTKTITADTLELLKKMLSDSVIDPPK